MVDYKKAQEIIRLLSDGILRSPEIAIRAGCTPKYVQRIWKRENLPHPKRGQDCGEKNTSWRGGYIVDLDGYLLVPAPYGHPHARYVKNKIRGRILEHRLVMELRLGRYLDPKEVVDHIDGDKMNNSIENLRLFQTNSEHLKKTLSGKVPQWSDHGVKNMSTTREHRRSKDFEPVSTYQEKKMNGEIRLKQMNRSREKLQTIRPDLLKKMDCK